MPTGVGERGWEEVPYWLKGFLGCAILTNDPRKLAEAKIWIEGAINSQQPDGWFGPVAEHVRPMIGDVVVAMTGRATVVDSRTQSRMSLELVGVHGSLTPEELTVPLLTVQA